MKIQNTVASPNDPKLSDCGARRAGCGKAAGARMGAGGGMVRSSQRDARSSSLQRMVLRCGCCHLAGGTASMRTLYW